MPLKLNKIKFSRNRTREKELADIFNETYNGITNIMPFIITLFFAPVLITTSLFSKELFFILANMSLCIGYLSNFFYRLYRHEMEFSELVISVMILTLLVCFSISYHPLILTQLFSTTTLGVINQVASAINLFFLIKHTIVPPFMRIIEQTADYLGINISSRYYSKTPFTLEEDRFIVDKMLRELYQYDSFSPQFNPQAITRLNNLLNKLCTYINKYDAPLLGYLLNREAITEIEAHINQLTVHGAAGSSYTFIRKKIDFKTTKIRLLEKAKQSLQEPSNEIESFIDYFEHIDIHKAKTNRPFFLHAAITCFDREIIRQKEKINSLEECLPLQRKEIAAPMSVF
ncbi:MAG: hypothetical protein CK426_05250 [Legionella sp.]|nr:MAG: hypothetical protein CK423_01740 [Legionella sp.]PJD98763.1 MAG: hypothetical protein CK426_05250 [Legionella sp.]